MCYLFIVLCFLNKFNFYFYFYIVNLSFPLNLLFWVVKPDLSSARGKQTKLYWFHLHFGDQMVTIFAFLSTTKSKFKDEAYNELNDDLIIIALTPQSFHEIKILSQHLHNMGVMGVFNNI